MKHYRPKTGKQCRCERGVERDSCPLCEGTGWEIDFAEIRSQTESTMIVDKLLENETMNWLKPPKPWPYTGRVYPQGAKLAVTHMHDKWSDLCYIRNRPGGEERVYLSSLPREKEPRESPAQNPA